MTHIIPKQREELSELEPMLKMVEASMGFLPTSMLTMAHWPELTQAFGGLGATVLHSGELDAGLKQMIAFAVSNVDQEKAALRVAVHAGMVPNAVEAEHMSELSRYFSEKQVIEVVAVISLFGFLNRWNDTMATTLESAPKNFAADQLASHGWAAGKHE